MENFAEKRAMRIRGLLTEAFAPMLLEIEDESAKHAGHAGHRAGGETHYKVKIISAAFAGMNKVAQHRAIYAALASEMPAEAGEGGIHALALEVSAS